MRTTIFALINMEYPRDNVFTFLFSTYKRTAGIAFTAILILAIPISLALISNQQDVRQRASETSNISPTATPASTLSTTPSPTQTPNFQKETFDFNDDGIVDEIDLNILYFGFSKRNGD